MSKKSILVFSLVVAAVAAALFFTQTPQGVAKGQVYGKPLDAKSAQTVALPALFAKTAEFVEKKVIVEGEIGQVCQTSGCWITLTDGTNQLFVQFYDFTVRIKPGTKVRASGQIRVRNRAPYLAASGLEVVS
jgi:hypothetical protein